MNVYKKILYITLIAISFNAKGQLSYGNEQFLFNPVLINPSLAGLHNGQAQLGYDARWLGIDGAPRTSFLRFDKMFNGNTGWDIAVISDRVGPISSISIANAFAYHLKITENSNLSFGLRHHLSQNYFNINPQLLVDQNDPLLLTEQTGVPVNNFDASLAFINTSKFMIGFSYRNLIQQPRFRNTNSSLPSPIQQSILSVNGWFNQDFDGFAIEAFGNFSASPNLPTTIQIGVLGSVQGKFGAGLNFSPNNFIGILAYVRATERINVFYNYNLPISDISKVSKQSHGVGVGFRIGKETLKTGTFFIQPTNESSINRLF